MMRTDEELTRDRLRYLELLDKQNKTAADFREMQRLSAVERFEIADMLGSISTSLAGILDLVERRL